MQTQVWIMSQMLGSRNGMTTGEVPPKMEAVFAKVSAVIKSLVPPSRLVEFIEQIPPGSPDFHWTRFTLTRSLCALCLHYTS